VRVVILSEATTPRSGVVAQSKDPYNHNHTCRTYTNYPPSLTLILILLLPLPVWLGHSCPTPLILILILNFALLPPPPHAAPWKSGASAPRKALGKGTASAVTQSSP